jgi:hypothetical protein
MKILMELAGRRTSSPAFQHTNPNTGPNLAVASFKKIYMFVFTDISCYVHTSEETKQWCTTFSFEHWHCGLKAEKCFYRVYDCQLLKQDPGP